MSNFTVTKIDVVQVALPETTTRMTHLAFLSRFTPQERLAVRQRTNESHPNYDPILDDAMFLFHSAKDIDVSLEMTQQLVGYMASVGLIDPERMTFILAPISTSENGALP